jgi:Nucleotidyltransferase substrate binding protein like
MYICKIFLTKMIVIWSKIYDGNNVFLIWMDMIESRNKTVHTYQEDILISEYQKIVTLYFPLLTDFYHKMKGLL